MHVLVLGGTGSIGAPVVRELRRRGHAVTALARSPAAAHSLRGFGATPIAGSIAAPAGWLPQLPALDAVVQAAAAFSDEDEAIERRLLERLLPWLAAARVPVRFIYTGGCWLYGVAGEEVTTEASAFDPLPSFAWGAAHSRLVLATAGIEAIVIHPAMVYEPAGGVFAGFYHDARHRDAVRVVGGEGVRWPLVHREDLAILYGLALERSAPGQAYLGAAIEGLPVGRIARAYARRFGTRRSDPEIRSEDDIAAELGAWARGYGRDQRQSGAKARRLLGWAPQHTDPERLIAALP